MKEPQIPVIDLFAGPGGLGEGFSSFNSSNGLPVFKIRLSIEKDYYASQTLLLRSFFRQFSHCAIPDEYYSYLRDATRPEDVRRKELFSKFPEQFKKAESEVYQAELGKENLVSVRERISQALRGTKRWVLIGGPPCQAYSIVGRSRNKGNRNYDAVSDVRQHLYVEYLQILADHRPAVFIMENVKGLLSATLNNRRIFERMLEDLQSPQKALLREGRSISRKNGEVNYKIYSLVKPDSGGQSDLRDFIVKMEQFGIPQARHRLILVGVRDDLGNVVPEPLQEEETVSASDVLSSLPALRSGLSREPEIF